MRTRKASKRRTGNAPQRTSYHHGSLDQALIGATLQLIEEFGPEHVSVREAARRAGVSPGAPFRHFPSRVALFTAVAEQALQRFQMEIDTVLAEAPLDDPMARLRAIGIAFLRWAFRNPSHFRVISNPDLVDWNSAPLLRQDNERIQALTLECVLEGQRRGVIRAGDPWQIVLAGRALVYGLARMYVDGHLPRWRVPEPEVERVAQGTLDVLLKGFVAEAAH